MAIRTMIDDRDAMVGDFPDIAAEDGKLTGVLSGALTQAIKAVIRKLNGLISLGTGATGHRAGNLDAQYIDILTPSVANTEFPVPHGLGRLVIGYDVVRKDRAVDIYDSNFGSWNPELLLLKATVASASVKLRVY